MKYVEPLFRPPAEADSLIFQVAYGCPHNSCRFCGMYKGVAYSVRDRAEVLSEIREAGRLYPATKRIFLADGDVMFLPFDDLLGILKAVNEAFPRLARVGVYANGSSIAARSEEQLKEMRKLKLATVYLGLETGDDDLLARVGKSENVETMVDAVRKAQNCGIKASVMVLLGLGGKKLSTKHAEMTAMALNKMQPRLLSALRYVEVPGLKMFDAYETSSEYDAVSELRNMISGLDLERTVFRANHASNPVPIGGRFPQDKQKLLDELDGLLKSSALDRDGTGYLPYFL